MASVHPLAPGSKNFAAASISLQEDRPAYSTVAPHPPAVSARQRSKTHILAWSLTALILRLAIVWLAARPHPSQWFFGQASELAVLAKSIHDGHGLSSPFGGSTGPSAFLAPGYPAIVAAIFALFAPYSHASAMALMTLQALFGAATVAVTMLLARRAFNSTAANLAGAVLTLSPPLLWLPTAFWESSLSLLLATSLAVLALYCADHPTLRSWLAAGLLAAFTLAVNPSLLPLLAGCLGWAFYRTWKRSLSAPLLGLSLCVLLSAPWAIRNYRLLHAFIPLRSNMGYELWQGNRPGADGFFLASLHPNNNIQEFHRYSDLGEVAYMREKSTLAKTAIAADPARFVKLSAIRAFHFWAGYARESATLIVVYIVSTSLAGLTGLFLLWRQDRPLTLFFLLPLLLFPLPYYITHPDFRFRLVLDPILVALGSYAATGFIKQ